MIKRILYNLKGKYMFSKQIPVSIKLQDLTSENKLYF